MKRPAQTLTRLIRVLFTVLLLAFCIMTPSHARFLSPDTWDPMLPGVDVNRYAYSGNDPINQSDPNGHQSGDDQDGDGDPDFFDKYPGIPDGTLIDLDPGRLESIGVKGGGPPAGFEKTLEKVFGSGNPQVPKGPNGLAHGLRSMKSVDDIVREVGGYKSIKSIDYNRQLSSIFRDVKDKRKPDAVVVTRDGRVFIVENGSVRQSTDFLDKKCASMSCSLGDHDVKVKFDPFRPASKTASGTGKTGSEGSSQSSTGRASGSNLLDLLSDIFR
jgi:hypothetical protein